MKRPPTAFVLGLIYAAAVAQVAVRDDLALGSARPDFLWAALAYLAFAAEGARSIVYATITGLLIDCLSPGPLGPAMLIAAIATWCVQRSRATRPSDEIAGVWIGRSLFIVVTMMISTAARWEALGQTGAWTVPLIHSAGDALYTVLLGLTISLVASPLRRLRTSRPRPAETPQTLTNQWKMLTP